MVLETTTSGIGSAVARIPMPIAVRGVTPFYINSPEEGVIPEGYKVSDNIYSKDTFEDVLSKLIRVQYLMLSTPAP